MTIHINKTYLLKFNFNGNTLTYTAKVISLDNNFISFVDKFQNTLNYNIINLVSYEEVKNGK